MWLSYHMWLPAAKPHCLQPCSPLSERDLNVVIFQALSLEKSVFWSPRPKFKPTSLPSAS